MSKVKTKLKQKWTKDMVKEVILDRRSKGLDITNTYFRKHKKPLYNAINRLYGTHAKAIEEIGLDYKEEFGVYPRGYWTDERIKNLVYQRLSKGQGIKTKEMMQDYGGLIISVYRKYGSWEKYIEKIGIDLTEIDMYHSKKQVNDAIQNLVDTGQCLLRGNIEHNHLDLYNAVKKHYGTWNKALKENNIDYSNYKTELKKKEIREYLVARSNLNKSMFATEVEKDDPKIYYLIRRYYKSHNKALKEAGVDIPKREQKWMKEVVKENIKERNEKGNSLRYKDACKDQLNLVAAAQRLFGDWRTAIRESGIDYDQHYAERFGRQLPKPRGYWTKEKIKEEMLKRKKEGKSLKYIHVKNENSRMAGTAYQLFGKWDELIEYIEKQPKEKPNL